MENRYEIIIFWSDEDQAFVADDGPQAVENG